MLCLDDIVLKGNKGQMFSTALTRPSFLQNAFSCQQLRVPDSV